MQSADGSSGARDSDLLTSGDVAKLADCAVETVRRWENEGKLAAARTASGMRLYKRSDVEKFLRERKPGGAA